jgi:hypothetical protein
MYIRSWSGLQESVKTCRIMTASGVQQHACYMDRYDVTSTIVLALYCVESLLVAPRRIRSKCRSKRLNSLVKSARIFFVPIEAYATSNLISRKQAFLRPLKAQNMILYEIVCICRCSRCGRGRDECLQPNRGPRCFAVRWLPSASMCTCCCLSPVQLINVM